MAVSPQIRNERQGLVASCQDIQNPRCLIQRIAGQRGLVLSRKALDAARIYHRMVRPYFAVAQSTAHLTRRRNDRHEKHKEAQKHSAFTLCVFLCFFVAIESL